MAAYLGAEQELKDLPAPGAGIAAMSCFPVGRAARTGQITREDRATVSASAEQFAPAAGPGGEISDVAIGQFATTAAQIAPRRHSAVDQRQLPRAVRFL